MKRLSVALLAAALVAGCGGGSDKPAPPVRLSVDAPTDMTVSRDTSVQVHGVVAPASADVKVEGKSVRVSGGSFSTNVDLLPGTNLIDVVAGAPHGARPAMVAVRVRREVKVSVPDLTGVTPSDAKDTLAGLGLKADIQESSGFLDFLLPEDARVCQTDPPSGTDVDPGSTVHVFAAKNC